MPSAQRLSAVRRGPARSVESLIGSLRNALKRLKIYAKVANKVTNKNA